MEAHLKKPRRRQMGLLVKGRGFGCIGNVLIGAIGGLIGGFEAHAGEQMFMQEMKFSESNGGTLLERRVSFDANPILSILFRALIGPMVANPSMRKTLNNLKAKMES